MLASTLVNGRSYFRTISWFFNHSFGKFKYRVLTLKKIHSWLLFFDERKGAKYKVHNQLGSPYASIKVCPIPPRVISIYLLTELHVILFTILPFLSRMLQK